MPQIGENLLKLHIQDPLRKCLFLCTLHLKGNNGCRIKQETKTCLHLFFSTPNMPHETQMYQSFLRCAATTSIHGDEIFDPKMKYETIFFNEL